MEPVDPARFIPHREPILMLDQLKHVEIGKRAVASKQILPGSPLFNGHVPGNPILPGIYLIEAIAQAGAVMLLSARFPDGVSQNAFGRLAFVRDVKFRRAVLPGETLHIEVTLAEDAAPFYTVTGKVVVKKRKVAEGSVVITIPED